MKITKFMIAAGMLTAGVAAASAESVYQQDGSGVQGQAAGGRDQQVTIRHLTDPDAAAAARSEQTALWLPSGNGHRPFRAIGRDYGGGGR